MNSKTFEGIYSHPFCKGCSHAVKSRICVFSRDAIFIYNSVEEFVKDHNFKLFPVSRFFAYRSDNLYTCDKYNPSTCCKVLFEYLDLPF